MFDFFEGSLVIASFLTYLGSYIFGHARDPDVRFVQGSIGFGVLAMGSSSIFRSLHFLTTRQQAILLFLELMLVALINVVHTRRSHRQAAVSGE
jgi:hypothetical protein